MINKSILAGRLTKDVNLRKTGTGNSVASFTLACNRRFVKDGEQEADFINCVAWRQSADFLAQYTGKGDLIGVEGRIQSRSYDDEKGRRVYVTEVVCDSVCILSKVAQNAQNQTTKAGSGYGAPSQGSNSTHQYRQTVNNEPSYEFSGFGQTFDIDSSDLPF